MLLAAAPLVRPRPRLGRRRPMPAAHRRARFRRELDSMDAKGLAALGRSVQAALGFGAVSVEIDGGQSAEAGSRRQEPAAATSAPAAAPAWIHSALVATLANACQTTLRCGARFRLTGASQELTAAIETAGLTLLLSHVPLTRGGVEALLAGPRPMASRRRGGHPVPCRTRRSDRARTLDRAAAG